MSAIQFFGVILILGGAVVVSTSFKPLQLLKIRRMGLGSALAFVGALMIF